MLYARDSCSFACARAYMHVQEEESIQLKIAVSSRLAKRAYDKLRLKRSIMPSSELVQAHMLVDHHGQLT